MDYLTKANIATFLFFLIITFLFIIVKANIAFYFFTIIQTLLLTHLTFNAVFDDDKSVKLSTRILKRLLGVIKK